ncbi:glycosyltransferase, partial [Candidatus Dojkabacteria bacterium]|nr:glycosyltransferase [Candidatus Dojkabacteria bacterium]
MNIALVHDQLVNYGGAEGVFLTLSKMYPKADIYTSFFDEKNPSYFSISDRIIKKISLPKSFRYSTLGKLIVNAYWQSLDLTKYDLVITSSDTFSCHSVITGPETTHVAYIHTPPRYLYAEDPNYYEIGRTSFIRNIIISYLRNCDKIASQRPDVIVVPSDTVKKRVLKYYRIKPLVIPCPVSTAAGIKRERTQDAYLLLGRIETHKGVELVVNAFARSKKKLLIAGIGKEYK